LPVSEFLDAVANYKFMQYALATGLLASVACGVVGTYVTMRRIGYIAGGISHCVLGGLGAANYLIQVHGWTWLQPVHGAVFAALLAAFIIGFVSLRAREREDTIIGALWAVGMAAGVLFIARTPGYSQDLMSYLFGNILMVTPADLWMVIALDVFVVGLGVLLFNQFTAICFDEEFARTRGLRVDALYMLLLCLTALTVVLLVSVVGIVLVIALLTLPVAVAGQMARSMSRIMILSSILCAVFTTGGLALSYAPNLPAGATIIVLAAAAYLAATLAGALSRRLRARASLK
jgi:zinc transport system permease protein